MYLVSELRNMKYIIDGKKLSFTIHGRDDDGEWMVFYQLSNHDYLEWSHAGDWNGIRDLDNLVAAIKADYPDSEVEVDLA